MPKVCFQNGSSTTNDVRMPKVSTIYSCEAVSDTCLLTIIVVVVDDDVAFDAFDAQL